MALRSTIESISKLAQTLDLCTAHTPKQERHCSSFRPYCGQIRQPTAPVRPLGSSPSHMSHCLPLSPLNPSERPGPCPSNSLARFRSQQGSDIFRIFPKIPAPLDRPACSCLAPRQLQTVFVAACVHLLVTRVRELVRQQQRNVTAPSLSRLSRTGKPSLRSCARWLEKKEES